MKKSLPRELPPFESIEMQVFLIVICAAVLLVVGIWLLSRYFARLPAEKYPVAALRRFSFSVFFLFVLLVTIFLFLQVFPTEVFWGNQFRLWGGKVLKAAAIVVFTYFFLSLGKLTVSRFLARLGEKEGIEGEQRAQTLGTLLGSALTYLLWFIAFLMILETFGVDTKAILAGAGIVGLAVGFGAQNLVRDMISGFFIIFEDQYRVGELVRIGEVMGAVEEMGIRTTKVREWTGQLHIIPNGEITKVANYNRGQMLAVVDMNIAYEEDLDRALETMRGVCGEMAGTEGLAGTPVVLGAMEFKDTGVTMRAIAPCLPGRQWEIERELRKRFKQTLDASGIEIPYPRRVVISRQSKDGEDKIG